MARKLIILEVNEVPLRVLRHFARRDPASNVAQLLDRSMVLQTHANDVEPEILYPSQTWASLNSGVPYSEHRVHWYNDPKPTKFPFYWELAAEAGRSTGIVNTLHSSPAARFVSSDRYPFFIPDCFATDSDAKPDRYREFQSFNLRHTSGNMRVARGKVSLEDLKALSMMPSWGIRIPTAARLARLVAQVKLGRVNKERLRNVQFLLLHDIFMGLTRRHRPDLAVVFTNHVAAAMHRYWYALFPGDYDRPLYDAAWRDRYRDEVMNAVRLLDDALGELAQYARDTSSVLVLTSSMGQGANLNPRMDTNTSFEYFVEDIDRLIQAFGLPGRGYSRGGSMHPQHTLNYDDPAAAASAQERMMGSNIDGLDLTVDVNGSALTLTVKPDTVATTITIDGQPFQWSDLGLRRHAIDDHHSGRHVPEGSLIVYNSPTSSKRSDEVDYLEFAPSVLECLGVEPPQYMRDPSFRL
ncbi:MAG: hypothetical protein R6X02_06060 [Enhygromyxa sp.]